MALVLLTNVTQYAGPGALEALQKDGHKVACHDASFVDGERRADFDKNAVSATALAVLSARSLRRRSRWTRGHRQACAVRTPW